MPGQPKYCEECKGYGNLYQQTIVRYGDKRIKENTPVKAVECAPCKGTGMITLQTEKVSQYDVQDEADDVITVTAKEEVEYADEAAPSEAPEPSEDDEEDDVVFEPKHIEAEEGDLPL